MSNELTTGTTELISLGNDAEMEAIARRYDVAAKIAHGMSRASILPDHLRTKKVEGRIVPLEMQEIEANCMLICSQALRWGVDPFALAPESYVVNGILGYQGKLVIGIINKLAGLEKNLTFEYEGAGDKMSCTCIGRIKGESDDRTAVWDVKRGATKDNENWRKDPEQQLAYATARRWARRHKPEVLLGIVSTEDPPEIIDTFARNAERPALPEVAPAKTEPDPELEEISASVEWEHLGKQYEKTILRADQKGTLERLVDKIRAEAIDVLPEPEQERLAKLARECWAALPDSEEVSA
jgi:hypothetical protein